MPVGPGKYDKECTRVRERYRAAGAVVIVIGGTKGEGFSMQLRSDIEPRTIVTVLRTVADEIERSTQS